MLPISGYEAHELAKNPRNETRTVSIEGVYRILRVDSSRREGFRFRLQNVETQDEITAKLKDWLAYEKEKALIRDAEWSQKLIRCVIETKRRGGVVVDAYIAEVELVPDD